MIQTTKRKTKPDNQHRGVVNSFGDVVGDVTRLAELQFQLFKVDCAACSRRVIRSLVLGTIALLILVGSIPLGLAALAAVLYEFGDFTVAASLGIVFAVGIVLTLVVGVIAIALLKSSTTYFDRSQTELKRNVEWLKGLKHRDRKPDHRLETVGRNSGSDNGAGR